MKKRLVVDADAAAPRDRFACDRDLLIDIFDFLLDVIVVLARDFFRFLDIRRRRSPLSADG